MRTRSKFSNQQCCPGADETVFVTRVVLADISQKSGKSVLRQLIGLSRAVIEYKAFAKMRGLDRVSRTQDIETKARARSILSAATSIAIPGDTDPIRSPIRSTIYRTITPGKPSLLGGAPTKPNRGYRCPEGYQYGGRFTDSRLSTCGAKLFDIPSPLGLAIAAIRRAARGPKPGDDTGKPITGGPVTDSIIQSRKPQIPRVGNENTGLNRRNTVDLVQQIGNYDGTASRMVRKDGFVLEPVVPPKVLRAIPDNRDMEGATYLLSALNPTDIGNEELGLLSNTGIRSLIYVMPGGSTLTLEKRRALSVGERRKLGRTVNSAMQIDTSRDPAARLKAVAEETGDGIGYVENFPGIKNPNEMVGDSERWATEAFKRKKRTSPGQTARPSEIKPPKKGAKINSLDAAIAHVSNGGNLSDISPTVLAQVLAESQLIQSQRLTEKQSMLTIGGKKFILNEGNPKYQHIGEYFASQLHRHLGLKSPDVIFADGAKDSRNYLRADVESVADGAKLNPSTKFNELQPRDVAAMMIADFLTDQRQRSSQSIYPIQVGDDVVPVLAQNTTSGLTALDKIQIDKRMKLNIGAFYEDNSGLRYSEYYSSLKKEQQVLFRRYIESLIQKARAFRMVNLRERLAKDGLTQGEQAHLNIIDKMYEMRLDLLSTSKRQLLDILKG